MTLDQLNVLLVDDSGFARSVGRRVLRNAGVATVLDVGSGQEAVDLLARPGSAVDAVFCDLMMPDMDGIQFIRCAAGLAVQPAIVFLSGVNAALLHAAEDTARARGLRVLGSIQKPLTLAAVHRVLGRLCETIDAGDRPSTVEATPQELDAALAKGQLLLHYQPKVLTTDGSVAGFEALVRWQHPERGLVLPDAFITVAERSGRIGALTERVTLLALAQSASWSATGLHTKVSINLSAPMLVDLALPDRMARDAERFGVEPRQLILEITESGLFQDAANTLDILVRLNMKGFPLSIDDFGTGYSAMEQLRRVPFAEMKIDRAFVNGAAENAKAKAILESSTGLGHSLDMGVVAEGVETQADWDLARTAGVDLVQGYFIAKPLPPDEIPAWLTEYAQRIPGA